MSTRSTAAVIEAHRGAGRFFDAAGVRSFALDEGEGAPIVCMHGMPTSSFLYRKVVAELAARGLRGIALDLPGMGLAERPADFDYTWGGLARWSGAAMDALGLDRVHLVLHDTGGPIGFEWAIRNPDRVLSITVLNTVVDVAEFRRPWSMYPFSLRGIGELWLQGMRPPMWGTLCKMIALAGGSEVSSAEINAYCDLLKREDSGRAFLRIIRGFELTQERQDFFFQGLARRTYPAQVVWGSEDPVLGHDRRAAVQRALNLDTAVMLPAKHFLQEEQAPAIADAVRDLVKNAA
jgi:haloalkane dehalogenase